MPMENSERTTARNTVKALSELTLRPKRSGRGTGTEPSKPKTADHGKNALSIAVAKAMVARAR